MKIIVKIESDNKETLKRVKMCMKEDIVVIPFSDDVKITIINDDGSIARI